MELYIIIGVVILALIILTWISYVKCGPNESIIISGIGSNPRILTGRGGFRIPFIEKCDKLQRGQVTIPIKTDQPVPTSDFISCSVTGVAKVSVMDTPEGVRLAARNFLGMTVKQIGEQVQDMLQGNLREAIGKIDLKTLNTSRDEFSKQIASSASVDCAKCGLSVIAITIQNITDSQGLIEGLGAENKYRILQNSSINKAEAERNIARAEAENKKLANDARIEAETAIAERDTQLALKKAELKKQVDTAKATADAAYEIQQQEQKKTINVKTIEAEIEKTKQEKVLSKEQIEIEQNRLQATIEKRADSNKYQKEKEAEAQLELQKRQAESRRYSAEQDAAAQKAKAEADLFQSQQLAAAEVARGEAEAKKIELEGKAKAEAIRAQGEAEAEAMLKKAEAYEKYGDSAKLQLVIEKLPEVAHAVANSIAGINGIKIYSGNGAGIEGVSSSVPVMIKQAMDVIGDTTGVDIAELISAKGIRAMTDRNINVNMNEGEVG